MADMPQRVININFGDCTKRRKAYQRELQAAAEEGDRTGIHPMQWELEVLEKFYPQLAAAEREMDAYLDWVFEKDPEF